MKIYHIAPLALLMVLGAQARTATPIVFDNESMMRHRLAGDESIELPAGAGVPVPYDGFDVEVSVSPEGSVTSARIPADANSVAEDSTAILAAARSWRFRPFLYRGETVSARGTIRIGYRMAGGWRDPNADLPPIDYSRLRIRLVRSSCFGNCPDYSVTIDGDGSVLFSTRDPSLPGAAEVHREYSSIAGVLLPGIHHGRIERSALDALIERFRAAHFFGLRPQYASSVTDNPTYQLSFESNGRSFAVIDYVGRQDGMPDVVTDLERAVDQTARTARWVSGDEDTFASLESEGFDFRSPEAIRLALMAIYSESAPDKLVLDLIGAGLPLDRTISAMRDEPARPLGEVLFLNAVRRHRVAVVNALAERGWLARISRTRLSSTFAESAGGCEPGIARMLVTAGADPMARTSARHGAMEAGGATALRVATSSYGPCSGLPLAPIVSALVGLGVDINAADSEGETALFGVEDPGLQEQLIALGARADVRDKEGNSAVFSSWNDRIVLGLLDAGADPNGRYYDGNSLRRQAHERDMPSVLAWLDAHGVR